MANKNLVINDVKEIEIHFPKSLAEQRAIVGRPEALSAETRRLEAIYQCRMEAAEQLRRSVLQRAFNDGLKTGQH
jgi:type I restriction enzyme, S subunit